MPPVFHEFIDAPRASSLPLDRAVHLLTDGAAAAAAAVALLKRTKKAHFVAAPQWGPVRALAPE